MSDTSWRDRAACRGMDPDLWHPEMGATASEVALDTCNACVVRSSCLEFALETRQRLGIWGGLSEVQRRSVLRRRNGYQAHMVRVPRPRRQAG